MTAAATDTDPIFAEAHVSEPGEVAKALHVDPALGLSQVEAARRLATAGRNELEEPRHPSVWSSLLETVTEPFMLLLVGAGLGAVLLGEVRDGLLILAALIPITAADVATEYRSERALEALKAAGAAHAHVLRNGEALEVMAVEVVPGDILLLTAGDVVAADARVSESAALSIDRSILTGESLPETASARPDPAGAPLLERRAMVYAGTSVVGGRGRGIVTATGSRTELGGIAGRLGRAERGRSPLERELDRLVRILLVAASALILVTVGLGFLRGQPAGTNLLAGISAAIAAIPEEPPVLLGVVLGLGAYRLLRRGVLVRRLSAQETLGAVDLIITDKTGTLTRNRLELQAVLTPEGEVTGERRRELLLDALRSQEDAWALDGTGRRGAFTRAIAASWDGADGPPVLDRDLLRSAHGPGEGRPYTLAILNHGAGTRELALGAPEVVLGFAERLDASERRAWDELLVGEAARGGRLLLLAERAAGAEWRPRAVLCFADVLRDEVPAAMAQAREAGIQVIVVTGDHPHTAAAIAQEAGLAPGEEMTGTQLGERADEALAADLGSLRIVARALPEQKLRLVRIARGAGRTVAVTGDGVNDAAALNNADVAVAMGSGTAVAREASDLVLGDDSFATLMDALREGRRIVTNVQKGLVFIVSTHVALLGFILIATIAGYGQPLLPIQILWLELFIDLSASVAFEREPEEPGTMRRPPRSPSEPLLSTGILLRIGAAGGFSAVAALAVLELAGGDFSERRWLAYSALVIGQALRAYANRSLSQPVHRLGVNGFLAAACAVAVLVQLIIPLVPPLATAFDARILSAGEWLIVAAIAASPVLLAEIGRTLRRRTTWVA